MIRTRQKEKWIVYTVAVLLCLVLVTFWLMCNVYAKYTAEGSGSDSARVALWGANQSIVLADTDKLPKYPGDTCTYTLSVSNQNQNRESSEVTQKYNMEIVTAGNLPLTYDLSENNQPIATFQETAQNKIWQIDKPNMIFQSDTAGSHTYTLKVTWSSDQNSAVLAGIPDYIQINIYAEQVD